MHIMRIGMIIIIGGLLTACAGADQSGTTSPTPLESAAASPTRARMLTRLSTPIPTADPMVALLRYYAHGGFCVEPGERLGAECEGTITLDRDGWLHFVSSSGPEDVKITAAELQTLTEQIAAMDLAAMRATPFTEMCPTAYDGREVVITFFTPTGPESLASCTTVMDFTQPPLSTVIDLLERYVR